MSSNPHTLNIRNLRALISPERMAAYELAAGAAGLGGAFLLYNWDVRLSGAFFEEVHYLEVVLRNALSARLAVLHGADDWYRHRDWFDPRDLQDVDDAIERLARRRKPVTPGRVVSELNLGFWRFMLAVRYDRILWQVPAGLQLAFPHLEDAYHNRGQIYDILVELNLLRNRIAHHQSILERDHLADHGTIVDVLGWISPDAAALVSVVGRVPAIVAKRPALVKVALPLGG